MLFMKQGLAKNVKPSIPSSPDVIVVNNRNKIIITNPVQEKKLRGEAFSDSILGRVS